MKLILSEKQFALILFTTAVACALPATSSGQTAVTPQSMKVLGEVDPRYLSYNVEAVEVTGGKFWAPFKSLAQQPPVAPPSPSANPASMMDSMLRYRPPIDLSNPKLRKLAAALAPAYLRVSGTWRNSSYFQDNDEPALKTVPVGFQNVMTRAEWKGVVEFAKAVDASIVASVATSAGTRDQNGIWESTQAKAFFDYTRSIGGHIAATEYMNEPNLVQLGGGPEGYGTDQYARDSKIFSDFLHKESPDTLYLGPGSAGEGLPQQPMPMPAGQRPGGNPNRHRITSEEILKGTGPIFNGLSYHVYYTRSRRCMGANGMDVNAVLNSDYLDRSLTVVEFYEKLRDQLLSGKPLWLTETGEASCGGDTWASEFVDSFRLLDQLGSLAQHSVKSVMINTLASSDYGLLDEDTYVPRPNYWAALLWTRTMGSRSLDPNISSTSGMRIYAQCMKNAPGGVSMLVLNVDKSNAHSLTLPIGGQRYTLSSPDLMGKTVLLNGQELKVAADGKVPEYKGEGFKQGPVSFAPTTISILTLPNAGNESCKRQ